MDALKNLFGILVNVCELEYDKLYDIGEYLDYENRKCRKKLVDKLAEECNKTVEEVKLARITLAEDEGMRVCSSCTLYIVLFSIIFTIFVGIDTYFLYYKYLNCIKEIRTEKSFNYQTIFDYSSDKIVTDDKSIDIKNQTYYFFNEVINFEVFDSNPLKIDKK